MGQTSTADPRVQRIARASVSPSLKWARLPLFPWEGFPERAWLGCLSHGVPGWGLAGAGVVLASHPESERGAGGARARPKGARGVSDRTGMGAAGGPSGKDTSQNEQDRHSVSTYYVHKASQLAHVNSRGWCPCFAENPSTRGRGTRCHTPREPQRCSAQPGAREAGLGARGGDRGQSVSQLPGQTPRSLRSLSWSVTAPRLCAPDPRLGKDREGPSSTRAVLVYTAPAGEQLRPDPDLRTQPHAVQT